MKVFEIAKVLGVESKFVVAAMGVTSHLKDIDDKTAREYIEANNGTWPVSPVIEPEVKEVSEDAPKTTKPLTVRFWSPKRAHIVGDIKFREWIYECEEGSREAKYLREDDIQFRTGVREIRDAAYSSLDEQMAFYEKLQDIMHTGIGRGQDAESAEGIFCVRSFFRQGELIELGPEIKNVPKNLASKVIQSKSLTRGM